MAKKTYIIRLYRIHDLDLITFIETHHFDLAKGVYSALTAFSKGEMFIINIPPKREEKLGDFKRTYARLLSLDTEKDAAAINLMSKIKNGYHNSFLKNILRLYLSYPISERFLNEENDMKDFDKMFDIFRESRRTVNAGKESDTNRPKKRERRYIKADIPKSTTTVEAKDLSDTTAKNIIPVEEFLNQKTELSSENEMDKISEDTNKTYDEVIKETISASSEDDDEITDLFSSFL